jgi:hypothetical protein
MEGGYYTPLTGKIAEPTPAKTYKSIIIILKLIY